MKTTLQKEAPVMVITGASRGIGRGMAEHFVKQGYMVVGCSRGSSDFQNDWYAHYQVDLADSSQIREWIRSVKRHYGHIDVLVCNAGFAPANLLLTMTSDETLDKVLSINISGTYLVCREVAKVMMLQQKGSIITVSSMAVGLHEEGTSAYSASKSAIVEMTKILAKELAPLGVTCNVVAPSMLMTDAVKILGEEIIQRALAKLTVKRMVAIEEVCNVVSFLAASKNSSITGQVIHMGLVT